MHAAAATRAQNWLLKLSLISLTCATSSVDAVDGSRSLRDVPIAAAAAPRQKPRVDVDNRKKPFVTKAFVADR